MPMFEVEEGLDSFDLLRRYGSREIAALIGAIIAARMGRMPVALNGPGALMAAALLYKADKRAVQHCLYVADQTEPEGIKSFCTECDNHVCRAVAGGSARNGFARHDRRFARNFEINYSLTCNRPLPWRVFLKERRKIAMPSAI